MNFAQGLRQIQQNLASLGPRRLMALGLIGTTLFGAIALGSYVVSRSDYQSLYIGLSAQDSSRMAATLSELGIPFEVSTDGERILVPASAVARARGVLAERGLPAGADAGYELFDKIGPLGLTTFMQEVTRVRALEGEITRTLASMSGITSARVHLVFGDKATFRSVPQKPSASVVLKLGVAPERAPIDAVQNVVAAAVPGLSLENVRVVSSDGAVLAAGGEAFRPGANKMLELEKSFAAQLRQNLFDALAPMLGSSNFQSSIAVRLNADQSTINENIFDPNSRVERSVRVVKEAGNSKDGAADQGVTVESNVPQGTDAGTQAGAQNQKSNQRRDEITNYEISSKSISTTSDGYRVENISVALVVNQAALRKADGTALNETEVAAKIAEIEQLAGTAVGLDTKRGDRLTAVAQTFLVDESAGEGAAGGGIGVFLQDNSSSMIMAAVLVLGLLAFVWLGIRPLLRMMLEVPGGSASGAIAGGAIAGPANQVGELEFATPAVPLASGEIEGRATRDMQSGALAPMVERLNELIGRDPEQAVAVFRRWINTDAAR